MTHRQAILCPEIRRVGLVCSRRNRVRDSSTTCPIHPDVSNVWGTVLRRSCGNNVSGTGRPGKRLCRSVSGAINAEGEPCGICLHSHLNSRRWRGRCGGCRRRRRCGCGSRTGCRSRCGRTCRLPIMEGILLGTAADGHAPVHPCMKVLVGRGGGIVIVACVSRLYPGIGLKWKGSDYVRKRIVSQPGRTVIGRPARPHPVTRCAGA